MSNVIKKRHGGKRPGAGRPKDPESIRSQFAEAEAEGCRHSYSLYKIWRDTYVMNHAHSLVNVLSGFTVSKRSPKTFLGPSQALSLSRFPKDEQPWVLVERHRLILEKFVTTYRHPIEKRWVKIVRKLLRAAA